MNSEQKNINIAVLAQFQSSDLNKLNRLNLLDRYDTKFLTHIKLLPDILAELLPAFKVLEIDDKKVFSYSNCYFDTEDFQFYSKHHNGNTKRLKIRNRKYLDSNACFIEIKRKSSAITHKVRQSVAWHDQQTPILSSSFIKSITSLNPSDLSKTLDVNYKRITLFSETLKEKITLDFDIEYAGNHYQKKLNNILLIEVKHKNRYISTATADAFKKFNMRPISSFSKYCIGIILTGQAKKYNRFKPKLLALNKIAGISDGYSTF